MAQISHPLPDLNRPASLDLNLYCYETTENRLTKIKRDRKRKHNESKLSKN